MREIPVASRTQRRMERRQRLLMLVLVAAVVSASFFLGVMVGERSATSALSRQLEGGYPASVEVAPPPPAVSQLAGSQRMTFFDDLPKGNAAPLGSGINLPRSGYPAAAPVTAPPPVDSAPPPAPRAEPAAAVPAAKAPLPAAPAKTTSTVPSPAKTSGGYILQVSSTKSQADAQRLADKLKGKGFGAYTERVDLGSRGIWYRVVAGSYADRAAADKAAASLRKQGVAADIRRK